MKHGVSHMIQFASTFEPHGWHHSVHYFFELLLVMIDLEKRSCLQLSGNSQRDVTTSAVCFKLTHLHYATKQMKVLVKVKSEL
jgi:hypothetical protein